MKCPNCRSSRVRRAKRTIGEKIFLSILLARPFRCEDCIHRYFGFLLASGSRLAGAFPDAKSLVYSSSTAALHSADHRRRGTRRKVYSDGQTQAPSVIAAPSFASLSKTIQQPSSHQKPVHDNGLPMRQSSKPKSEFFPEILGIILEVKHQTGQSAVWKGSNSAVT